MFDFNRRLIRRILVPNERKIKNIGNITMLFKKSEAPAAERNKEPILQVLKNIIQVPPIKTEFPSIKVLEIASGTGQHISHFAKHMSSNIFWQPSEYDRHHFPSICAYIVDYKLKNVAFPVCIDIRTPFGEWHPECKLSNQIDMKPITTFEENSLDFIYNSNLMHISTFDCTEGLFKNSAKLLKKNGCLITYGPYKQNGVITPESNIRFDNSLKSTNPCWGLRDIQFQLIPLASQNGLLLTDVIDMPANNKILVWVKQ